MKHPFAMTLAGVFYPTNYITAVIDDLDEATLASVDLQQVGFATNDIVFDTNLQAFERIQSYKQRHGLLKSFMSFVASVASDEADVYLLYALEAAQGHHLLNVYAPKPELVERAHRILKAHHAHTMKFFGRWTVADLL